MRRYAMLPYGTVDIETNRPNAPTCIGMTCFLSYLADTAPPHTLAPEVLMSTARDVTHLDQTGEKWIPVSSAALRVRRSYHATLRLVLVGELKGRRSQGGRWEVSEASVEAYLVGAAAATS